MFIRSIRPARTLLTFATLSAIVAIAPCALADVLPPNACTGPGASSAGDSCETAGPSHDQPGICVAATCTLGGNPFADAAPTQQPCSLCDIPDGGLDATVPQPQDDAAAPQPQDDAAAPQPSNDGAAPQPWNDAGHAGDGDASTPATGSSAPASSDSGGCSASPLQRDGAVGGAMIGLGLAALAWSRRKKRA